MKRINNSPRVILTCLVIILFACMAMGSVDFPWAPEDEYPSVIDNRREAEARVARDCAKKVQKKWSKKEIEPESFSIPFIVLICGWRCPENMNKMKKSSMI
ncbi:MAG: hypothetical protein K6E63_06515 [Lachnospiraceae bacterium]|nr:hypothetical protein [Lachnospiraceae bacterium]